MAVNWRKGGMFGAGLLLGVLGTAALFAPGPGGETPPRGGMQATLATAGGPPAARADCSFSAIVAAAGEGDGRNSLDEKVESQSAGTVSTLIVEGKEASAAGRPRDAEVAFLRACRTAEGLKNDPVPLADAMYQLGRHYAQLAGATNAPKRAELLRRAEALYATSLQAYLANRGAEHEKTKFAQDGLADVREQMAKSATSPAVATAPAPAAAPVAATPAPAPVAATPAPAPVAAAPARAPVAAAPVPAQVAAAPVPARAVAAPPLAAPASVEPKPSTELAKAPPVAAEAPAPAPERRRVRRPVSEPDVAAVRPPASPATAPPALERRTTEAAAPAAAAAAQEPPPRRAPRPAPEPATPPAQVQVQSEEPAAATGSPNAVTTD